jgi:hypothetical protein
MWFRVGEWLVLCFLPPVREDGYKGHPAVSQFHAKELGFHPIAGLRDLHFTEVHLRLGARLILQRYEHYERQLRDLKIRGWSDT